MPAPSVTVCAACTGAPEPAPQDPASAGKALPYEVDVAAKGSGFRSDLQAGEYTLILDAAPALGGAGTGASPVQAFVSSIVACTQITLQIVAKEAGVHTGDIQWRGFGVFDARRLLSGSSADPRFQRIQVHGTVTGSVDQATLDELSALTADRCPISQSLHPSIKYELKLAAQA